MEGRRASGAVFHPWGTDVRGRLTYDDTGHAALQIAKGSRERFASDDLIGEDELVLRSMPLPYGGEAVEFQTRWVRARG